MITATNIRKSFNGVTAVEGISFQVRPGDVVGFLGPNGAGKSTTMKMLTGFLTPDSGEIRINDLPIENAKKAIQQQMGYLPEGAPSYADMTPIQMLDFIAEVRGLSSGFKRKRINEVIDLVSLDTVLDKPIEQLSKGFKRRVGLAQAILHDPSILILDEPTDGLDPNQKYQVRELISQLSKDKMVIISTHILEEVSAVCNRAMVLAKGQILFDSTPQALQAKSAFHQAVSIHFDTLPPRELFLGLDALSDLVIDESQRVVTLFPKRDTQVRGEALLKSATRCLQDNAIQARAIYVEQGRLDEVFRQMTQETTVQRANG